MDFKKNYHSHTARCGHARGRDEQYVLAAIEAGFETIGFSDHVILPDRSQPGMRGHPSLLEGYIRSVQELKKKYEGRIEILLAFECEWYGDRYASYYQDLLSKRGFDYLLLGQHCFLQRDHFTWHGDEDAPHPALVHYVDTVIDGLESGLFAYLCHPDLFMLWYPAWDEFAEEQSLRLIRRANELHIPLEFNFGPSRSGAKNLPDRDDYKIYPYSKFWQLVAKEEASVILGVDAHQPSDYAKTDYAWAFSFIKECGLKWEQNLSFKK